MLSANPQLSKSPVRKHVSRQIFNHNIVNLALSLSILIYFNFPAPLVPAPPSSRLVLHSQDSQSERRNLLKLQWKHWLGSTGKRRKGENFVLITFVLLNHTNLRGGGWGWWMSQDDVFLFRAIQSWNSYNKCVCVCSSRIPICLGI